MVPSPAPYHREVVGPWGLSELHKHECLRLFAYERGTMGDTGCFLLYQGALRCLIRGSQSLALIYNSWGNVIRLYG